MSLNGEQLEEVSKLVESSSSIVILLTSTASIDEVAAATSWASALKLKGKEVRIIAPEISPTILTAQKQGILEGASEISTELGKQNLVVSFAYSPEQVDKVSYHIGEETNRFYLTIRPQKGVPPLSQDSLEMSYAGAEADLLLYVGIAELGELQPLASEYESFFRDTPSISLSTGESLVGQVKIQTNSAAGYSEESAQLFIQLGWQLDESSATALLFGIEDMTKNLASLSTTPDTFETVAHLLRAGARRKRVPREEVKSEPPKKMSDVLNRGASVEPQNVVQSNKPTQVSNGGSRYQARKRHAHKSHQNPS